MSIIFFFNRINCCLTITSSQVVLDLSASFSTTLHYLPNTCFLLFVRIKKRTFAQTYAEGFLKFTFCVGVLDFSVITAYSVLTFKIKFCILSKRLNWTAFSHVCHRVTIDSGGTISLNFKTQRF